MNTTSASAKLKVSLKVRVRKGFYEQLRTNLDRRRSSFVGVMDRHYHRGSSNKRCDWTTCIGLFDKQDDLCDKEAGTSSVPKSLGSNMQDVALVNSAA